jgi:homoserine kinase
MSSLVSGPVRVRVPASSANLGPGFDTLGLALSLHDEVTAEVADGVVGADGGPGLRLRVEGECADRVPRDETHLVYRCMVRAFGEMGVPVPPVDLHCKNAIPHGRGLGSSSAAIVAGLAVARALTVDGEDRWDDDALFRTAAELEGHPDNVAPAVYGGFTIAYEGPEGYVGVRLEVRPRLAYVLFVPPSPLSTEVARGLLPEHVSHSDAVWNAGRAALLVAALTGRPDQLLPATEDRLHQGYRASAMPASADLLDLLRAEGHAAVVSGAGPTVLAVVEPQRAAEVADRCPPGWRVLELPVDPDGVRVVGGAGEANTPGTAG